MKLCFLADARSPIAQNWISYFIEANYEVHIISSYPCDSNVLSVASLHVVPVAFSMLTLGLKGSTVMKKRGKSKAFPLMAKLRGGSLFSLSNEFRNWLGPFDVRRHMKEVHRILEKIKPDLVHAMRIPFEGILAAKATPSVFPLLISVWGNDFTLHAKKYPLIAKQTRQAMQRADALHCDCQRDLLLAEYWSFTPSKPARVLPGAGGIQMNLFHPGQHSLKLREQLQIPKEFFVIINPRGFRGYVRNDSFFKAIPLVLQEKPETVFVCSGMKSNPNAEKWVDQFEINENVRLLPFVPREQMTDLFRLALITVSPSVHDGTPNTLLEAMASGSFPIVGDIESVREWIEEGINGLLCDPTQPESIAHSILKALDDTKLREKAKDFNLKLIAERAEYGKVMRQAEEFYKYVIEHHHRDRIDI